MNHLEFVDACLNKLSGIFPTLCLKFLTGCFYSNVCKALNLIKAKERGGSVMRQTHFVLNIEVFEQLQIIMLQQFYQQEIFSLFLLKPCFPYHSLQAITINFINSKKIHLIYFLLF